VRSLLDVGDEIPLQRRASLEMIKGQESVVSDCRGESWKRGSIERSLTTGMGVKWLLRTRSLS
jgi:hypothetical protein